MKLSLTFCDWQTEPFRRFRRWLRHAGQKKPGVGTVLLTVDLLSSVRYVLNTSSRSRLPSREVNPVKNFKLYALAQAVLTLAVYCPKLVASSEQIIFTFPTDGSGGSTRTGGLITDAAGNLYGVTEVGGAFQNGAVFKLSFENGAWSRGGCTHSPRATRSRSLTRTSSGTTHGPPCSAQSAHTATPQEPCTR
jgi:uncharacterized repeat protein (TIGR03803 family)